MRRRTHRVAGWWGLIVRRLGLALVTLLAVSVLVFVATQVLPGDAARAILGQTATPERLEALRQQLHLGDPALIQYWRWVSGVATGDPGISLTNGEAVIDLARPRIVNTAFLVLMAAIVSIPLSMLLGIASAVRRDGFLDHATTVASSTLAAIPEFVVGIGLVVLLGTTVLNILPPVSLVRPGQAPWSSPSSLVLPVLTLVLAVTPYVARILRGSMVEVLERDFIEMARLKGLARSTIVYRHALPNALGPTAQAIALSLAYLAGGAVVVEYVFAYPGMGQALVNAVVDRDVPVIQFFALLLAAFYVFVNLAADVVTILVTPRVRSTLHG